MGYWQKEALKRGLDVIEPDDTEDTLREYCRDYDMQGDTLPVWEDVKVAIECAERSEAIAGCRAVIARLEKAD